jgi:hypothetical protein
MMVQLVGKKEEELQKQSVQYTVKHLIDHHVNPPSFYANTCSSKFDTGNAFVA